MSWNKVRIVDALENDLSQFILCDTCAGSEIRETVKEVKKLVQGKDKPGLVFFNGTPLVIWENSNVDDVIGNFFNQRKFANKPKPESSLESEILKNIKSCKYGERISFLVNGIHLDVNSASDVEEIKKIYENEKQRICFETIRENNTRSCLHDMGNKKPIDFLCGSLRMLENLNAYSGELVASFIVFNYDLFYEAEETKEWKKFFINFKDLCYRRTEEARRNDLLSINQEINEYKLPKYISNSSEYKFGLMLKEFFDCACSNSNNEHEIKRLYYETYLAAKKFLEERLNYK